MCIRDSLQVAGAVAHRRSDVGQLVLRRTGDITRAILETLRLLILGSGVGSESLADVGRRARDVALRTTRVPGVPVAAGSAGSLRSTALARGISGREIISVHSRTPPKMAARMCADDVPERGANDSSLAQASPRFHQRPTRHVPRRCDDKNLSLI